MHGPGHRRGSLRLGAAIVGQAGETCGVKLPNDDPYLNRLHLCDDWRQPIQRFTRHPEIVTWRIDQISEWLRSRPASPG
jgi:hypothetical protein